MGEQVIGSKRTRARKGPFRHKVRACLDALRAMLAEGQLEMEAGTVGCELELSLVDESGSAFFGNLQVVNAIDDPTFQAELGAFNLEINLDPRPIAGPDGPGFEHEILRALGTARTASAALGAEAVTIGILPTLRPSDLRSDEWMSPLPRYHRLNRAIVKARGEQLVIDISAAERLTMTSLTIAPEAACTSVQFHLQVPAARFAASWNSAQLLAAPQVAIGCNSPYLFGRELWHETRIPLFAQATDARPPRRTARGERPRVWFGERWIESIADLFEENLEYFPPLLAELWQEDPAESLAAGRAPNLAEMRLHNGTIWRWNRPVYDVVGEEAHVRVENRVLPSGPTPSDMSANALFFFGAVHALAELEGPTWATLPFGAAQANFEASARQGPEAQVQWPGLGHVPVRRLIGETLVPLAARGLAARGVGEAAIDQALSLITERAVSGVTGSTWQIAATRGGHERGLDRAGALKRMFAAYREFSASNEPVHTWPTLV